MRSGEKSIIGQAARLAGIQAAGGVCGRKVHSRAGTMLGVRSVQVRMVILPRYDSQFRYIRKKWPSEIKSGKVIIPAEALDGQNLLGK